MRWLRANADLIFGLAIPLWLIAATMSFMAIESRLHQNDAAMISVAPAPQPDRGLGGRG